MRVQAGSRSVRIAGLPITIAVGAMARPVVRSAQRALVALSVGLESQLSFDFGPV